MPLFCPLPAHVLRSGAKTLDLSAPKVMGILNLTPDSFSDGGQFNVPDKALVQVAQMLDQGMDVLDIGAESTRPHARPVSDDEQLRRLLPVVRKICQTYPKLWLSIDTSSPVVMQAMADLGADMWNDVRALKQPGAAAMASRLGLPVVLMHARGEPDTMNDLMHYNDPIAEIKNELQALLEKALHAGIKPSNLVLDVGMGFAKNFGAHHALLKHLNTFSTMGYPLLFGVSRKRFLGEILYTRRPDHVPAERDAIGTAAALLAVQQGASIIRTHCVGATVDALALWQTLTQSMIQKT